MGTSQQFSLRWNNYLRHITCAFDSLRNDENLVDVTLSCEGKKIRAHRMLLSACSTYFLELFKENPCQHPVVIFRNIKYEDLSALVDFMYQGEVNVIQEQLASFLATAELLAIQGLSDGNGSDGNSERKEHSMPDSPSLPPEPEVQLSNNSRAQKLIQSSGRMSDVSSPVSFFPLDRTCDSPPSNKRRKFGGSATASGSGSNTVHRDIDTPDRERRRAPLLNKQAVEVNQEAVEIIPVMPSLKMEMPDYDDEDPDASSCSYDDSNQGAGPGGGALSALSRLVPHANASTSNCKPEPSDTFNTNSRDEGESLSAADISHLLAKPGSSGENQSQDSLQEPLWGTEEMFWSDVSGTEHTVVKASSSSSPFLCQTCGKRFAHKDSLTHHRKAHEGHTMCPVCHKVFSRIYALKVHMLSLHRNSQYDGIP